MKDESGVITYKMVCKTKQKPIRQRVGEKKRSTQLPPPLLQGRNRPETFTKGSKGKGRQPLNTTIPFYIAIFPNSGVIIIKQNKKEQEREKCQCADALVIYVRNSYHNYSQQASNIVPFLLQPPADAAAS